MSAALVLRAAQSEGLCIMRARIVRVLKWSGGAIAILIVTTIAGAGGVALGAMATGRVIGFVALGVALHACAGMLLARLFYRRRERPWRASARAALPWTAVVASIAVIALWPRPPENAPPLAERGAPFELVRLSTGSRVAVAQLGDTAATPRVVFLHGGPGGFVRSSDVELFRDVASAGFRVVLFDQPGGGASERLDLADYHIARQVADVEALRVHLGDERVVLVGQSWGARLAYEYYVAHPERVTRMIFLSPGPLRAHHAEFDVSRAGSSGPSFPPYAVLTFFLFQVSPDAALDFLSRDQFDAFAASQLDASARRAVCRETVDRLPRVRPARGLDAYAMIALRGAVGSIDAPPPPDVRVPSLVLRGACDYLVRGAAEDYVDTIGATLVEVPGVGHQLWFPERAPIVERIVAFLREEPR
jgi:proline iminopeptidase